MAVEDDRISDIPLPINTLIAITSDGATYVIPAQHLEAFRHRELEDASFENAVRKINGAGLIAAAYRQAMVVFQDA